MYWSLPRSAGVQDNLEEIHAIIWIMCTIWQEIMGAGLLKPVVGIGLT